MSQLNLFESKSIIETVIIQPTKDMPLEVFKHFHRITYFMELMERTPEGLVIWDEEITDIYSEDIAEAEYQGLQKDWFTASMELPKKIIDDLCKEV